MKTRKYNKKGMYKGVKYQVKEISENLFELTINGKKYDDEEIPYMYETNVLQALRSCEIIIKDNIYFK